MDSVQMIKRLPGQIISFTLLISFILCFTPKMVHADNGYRKLINCDLHDDACTHRIHGTDVILAVTPRPVQAMKDLVFTVTLPESLESLKSPPVIDLSMPGMDMGPNRVRMISVGKNKYEGKGVIVKCPSGHRVWKATVTVPEVGAAEFIFDVIY
jgi:hypothetical protein